MAGSRLPLLRRISQIFFLLAVSCAAHLHFAAAQSRRDRRIHLRAPVRLFFVLDPLVAIANALAGHALYRGPAVSLVILMPTLFLGRFFCGWICPMGTLQHLVGNMPVESKRGKQRIDSNRYKRWQTIKYVVLIAGLVAACFGSMVLGVARSVQPSGPLHRPGASARIQLCRARACLDAAGAQPRGRPSRPPATALHTRSAGHRFSISARRISRKAWCSAFSFSSFSPPACASRGCGAASICPLGALLGAVRAFSVLGLHKDEADLQSLQPLPAPLPGRRRPDRRRAVAQGRMPDVHELRGRLPGARLGFPLLPSNSSKRKSPRPTWAAAKRLTGTGRRRGRRSR